MYDIVCAAEFSISLNGSYSIKNSQNLDEVMEKTKLLLKYGKAEEALARLEAIKADISSEYKWQLYEMEGAAYYDLGNAEGAARAYFNAAKADTYLRSQCSHYSNYLFALHYLDDLDNDSLANEHFRYNMLHEFSEHLVLERQNTKKYPMRRYRIGYIAPNYLESSAARFYEALLTDYNRNEFLVECFSMSAEKDSFTERVEMNVDKFLLIDKLSIEEVAETIAAEGIDILFDLGGHSEGGLTLQVMARRPAPIQIAGLGWFDTTGLKAIDYILTDNYLTPIGHDKYFSERLLRLNGAFAFTPSKSMINHKINTIRRPLNTTFGSFNNFMKVTDDYLKAVKTILDKVEGSKFIMQDTTGIPARKVEMLRRLKMLRMPLDRIEVRLGNDDYLNNYAEIDIMLDTFPYNGGAMTATALYMGIPTISLYGTRYSSRFGADILRLGGIVECISNSRKEYIAKAVSLGEDNEALENIRQKIRTNFENSKLLGTKVWVRELEDCYKRIQGSGKNFCKSV